MNHKEISSTTQSVEPFQDKMMSDQSVSIMGHLIYVGHKLHFFSHLGDHKPITAEVLAEQVSCYPRFVRDWLESMVTAGWLTYDPITDHFALPKDYAFFLDLKSTPLLPVRI